MVTSEQKLADYTWKLATEDNLLKRIRAQSDRHRNQHRCDVHPSSPVKGRLLDILVRVTKSRRVLEVGCGLGYSAIWLARALPAGGRVDTIERDRLHASMAQRNLRAARLLKKVRILNGEAFSILSRLGPKRYDFVFEDAAYGGMPKYYEHLLHVLKVGGYIQFSNWFPIEPAILGGRHLRKWKRNFGSWSDAPVRTKRFVEEVLRDRRLSAILVPFVWFGMAAKITE